MFILTGLYYAYFSKSIHSKIETEIITKLKYRDTINRFFIDERINDIRSWADMSMPEVCLEYKRPEAMQVFLNRLKHTYKTYAYITTFDSEGVFFASDAETPDHFKHKLQIDLAVFENEKYIISLDDNNSQSFFTIISPIYNRINERIGYISAHIAWAFVDSMFENTNQLLESKSGIISYNKELFYNQQFLPINQFAQQVNVRKLFIQDIIKGEKKENVLKIENDNYTIGCQIMGHEDFNQLGVIHCILSNRDAALAPLHYVKDRAIIIALISIGLIIFFSFIIAGQVLRPFQSIMEVINKYKNEHDGENNISLSLINNIEHVKETIIDLLDRLMTFEGIARSNAKLAAIGQTTSMLAHDVRKPFSLIKSVLNSLDACKKDPVWLSDAKKAIGNSIDHVELMINDIMDFASNVTVQVAPTPLADVLKFSINIIAQHFSNAQVQLSYLFMHGHQPLLNSERMSRVIINIMSNAIEAMIAVDDLDDMSMWVQTTPIETNNKKYMQLIIGNKGSHISDDDFPQLFESFFTKGKKGGIGIGLASAQKIVNLHGGEIIARNSVNPNGVEFVITLPMSDIVDIIQPNELPHMLADALLVSDQSIADDKRSQKIDQLKQNERSYKILLLEDEILYRASVRNTIKERADLSECITLYDAHTVDEAVTLLQKEAITHAIVDIDLADDKTGFEFLSIAREEYPDVMLMVHSNRCIDADKEKAFDLGASAFVPKPLTIDDLINFLSGAIVQKHSSAVLSASPAILTYSRVRSGCELADALHLNASEQPPDGRKNSTAHKHSFAKVFDSQKSSTPDKSNLSFLLVNDENYILTVLKLVLKDYMSAHGIDATYHTAINYKTSENILTAHKIDIIISDLNLNESSDGFDVIALAQTHYQDVHCYMMTGMDKREIVKQLAAHRTTCLSIPPTNSEIQGMLDGL